MASFSVDSKGLLDSSDDLTGVTNSIKNAIDALDSAVANFLRHNAGLSPDAYNDAQRLWDAGIAKMHAAIGQASVALTHIHDNYDFGDRRGAAMFGGGGHI